MEISSPQISIIVPIYNAERYLVHCLDSLVNQTYSDIEIICVNDGSTDSSVEIVSSYITKDTRIILVNKENGGVSSARNVGIKKATGKYVMFVDSDDWLEETACELAVECAQKDDLDVVIWSYISEGNNSSTSKELFANNIFFDEKLVKDKLHRRFIGLIDEELAHPELADSLCPVWGKLYRRSIITENSIKFIDLKEIGTYEDGMFNLEVFRFVKRAFYINKCLYHYRREERKSVTSGYKQELYIQWNNLFEVMRQYISKYELDEKYYVALDNRIALSIVGLTLNVVRANISFLKKRDMIKEILSSGQYKKAYAEVNMMYFPIYWKVFYFCAKCRLSFPVLALGMVIQKIVSR